MPMIHFDGPTLSIDQKRSLIHGMSQAASMATGLPMPSITVVLDEHEFSNMGIGGDVLTESPYWDKVKEIKD
ncbi:tautomerase family protein [Desulfitobacterium sp.]|uniref:tautomerase family protein n=1 Tax=Desulfitobacterium sp. TaxID=49981 RepID=UPI002CE7B41E|nr:tautomerase family protein [Desulfitobacterium sp.]HVJ48260.1 tautomerase family protein [Desulfitobacterium sp.]